MAAIMRAGVIGAGIFGGYHAEKWAGFPGVRFAAVYDSHPERARALAAKWGGEAFADIAAFLDAIDIVSIASPAVSHGSRALQALRAAKPVYIEKPLAVAPADADAIVAEAAKRGLIVACGFLERAAFQAIGLFAVQEQPTMIATTRVGASSPRNQDVSVVLDLMIHDIDLILVLTHGAPLTVEAEGTVGATGLLDEAWAEVTFDNGTVARLHASRVAVAANRTIGINYPSGAVEIDLVRGRLVNGTSWDLDVDFAAKPEAKDRLATSLKKFLDAVKGKGRVLADAQAGVNALDLALAVEQAASG